MCYFLFRFWDRLLKKEFVGRTEIRFSFQQCFIYDCSNTRGIRVKIVSIPIFAE
ncbi:hypothetical protein LEP1GSC016_4132 [Leptospira borgpetersenii serovar Hardjo-bovis str. Sponselee]|uniref:Uncharacterized protein n=1 Tax=Leptospira borgpetersenii serovar Hardjo-bovis str. Sponselee TaxID=1303729 RepID=M6C1V5_LEPBO|nr:hypothetical protein LEP1GSC016_4132 [Leptospira borgpetersenii serovar Hardjo-bovis str. Sponselee]